MKTKNASVFFLGLFLCVIGLTSCNNSNENDKIWDFTPIVLYISVQDAEGNDLLNPDTPGNIADEKIVAQYGGKTYEKDIPVNQTRAYLAHFNGLQTYKNKNGKYFLTFGEFQGEKTYNNEQVIIKWNDNTESIIAFSSKLTWDSEDEPVFNRKFSLNGEQINEDSPIFLITRK